MRAFRAMAVAQGKGYLRDRQMLFWTIAFPLMFLVLFGGIFTGNGDAAKMKVVQVGQVALFDRMPAEGKAWIGELMELTPSTDQAGAIEQVRKGEQDAAIAMDGNTLRLYYSQADQVKAATVRGTMDSIVQRANQAISGVPPALNLQTQQVEDASLKAIQYVTPGLLAWAISMSATFGAGMTLVQWRQSKLLRRLRLSPVHTTSVIGARTLITLVVAMVQAAIFLLVGMAVFGLRLSGAWWAAIPLMLCGALAFQSIGLLVGAFSKTPEGASGLANLIILPMAFLSGTFIPLDVAPGWIRTLSRFLPMGHLNEGMSAVMVRGQGAGAILVPMAVLLAFAIGFALVAARLFRWDAD